MKKYDMQPIIDFFDEQQEKLNDIITGMKPVEDRGWPNTMSQSYNRTINGLLMKIDSLERLNTLLKGDLVQEEKMRELQSSLYSLNIDKLSYHADTKEEAFAHGLDVFAEAIIRKLTT